MHRVRAVVALLTGPWEMQTLKNSTMLHRNMLLKKLVSTTM
jgi:hypothetical protein